MTVFLMPAPQANWLARADQATADLTADQTANLARIVESSLDRRLHRPLSVSLLSGEPVESDVPAIGR